MIIEATQVIRDRQNLRERVRDRVGALEAAGLALQQVSGAQLQSVVVATLEPDVDITAQIARTEELAAAIASKREECRKLEAELAEARAFRAKMTKYGMIGAAVLVLLLIFLVVG